MRWARRQLGGGASLSSAVCGGSTKQFKVVVDYNGERADLALSLDVYHLVEDAVFEEYMTLLLVRRRASFFVFERVSLSK